jgi:hypothetical protein
MNTLLINTTHHPKGQAGCATFEIRDGWVYTTSDHSDGVDPNPWYEVNGDSLFPAAGHPQRAPRGVAWYVMRGGKVYAAEGHPHGVRPEPWFDLKETP